VNNDKIFVFLSISNKNLWLNDKIDLRYIFDLLFYVGHHRESSFKAKIIILQIRISEMDTATTMEQLNNC
jgi:hypothetical protein